MARTLFLGVLAALFFSSTFVLNRASVSAFNGLYYLREGARQQPFLSGAAPFFYPLDGIRDWNRLYGKPGFVQDHLLPMAAQRAHDGQHLLRGFALAENDLRRAVAHRAVQVHLGETEIFKGQRADTRHGLGNVDRAGTDCLQ